MRRLITLVVGCTIALVTPKAVLLAAASSSDSFYRGKQITLIISDGVGGGYDSYARVLARYLGDHIQGSPAIVPQNMTGAGALNATNYLYNTAPRDGTTLGVVFGTVGTADLLSPSGVRFDPLQFNWLGTMQREVTFCGAWYTARVKTFSDLKKIQLIVGNTGAGNALDQEPHILNNVFGTRIKVISGYASGNDILLALERGEVEGRCGLSISTLASTRPQWLGEKKLNLLVQFGIEKNPDFPRVPLAMDMVSEPETKTALKLAVFWHELIRPLLAPPGVPKQRVDVLRRAFIDTMDDPRFLADAAKENLGVHWTSGETVQAMIEDIHNTPPRLVRKAIDMMAAP